MTAPVTIRRATAADLAPVLRLLAQLAPTWHETDAVAPITARAEQTWTRMLHQDGRVVLVAERAGRIVGTLDLVVIANLTDDATPTAIVQGMVVDQPDRGSGIGRALIEAAIDLARDAGCCKLELLSSKARIQTHRFYRAVGFEDEAEGFRLHL
jgi:GNAT superfamily N-acetyltransferase